VRLDNIGDVIALGPALRTLRAALPDARITLLASPAGSQVAPLLPEVDAVLTRSVVWQDAAGSLPPDPARELALVDDLRRGRFDAAFVFTSWSQSPWPPAYACYLAGIPIRVGESKEFGGSLLTHRVPSLPDGEHVVDRNLHLLTSLGFRPAGHDLRLRLPPADATRARALLAGAGIDPDRPFAALAPGATCAARRYDPERFGRVAAALAARGLPVVVLASERERRRGLVEPVLAPATTARLPIASLAGRTSLGELAAVIGRAAVVVCNDSAPMHIADALDRPLVALYSGTELESQWGPRKAPARLLRRPTPCAPCYRFDCPFAMECLDIPPEEVVDAATALLDRTTAVPA
jgi:ADP-heptose:LPS heptosyltransferase